MILGIIGTSGIPRISGKTNNIIDTKVISVTNVIGDARDPKKDMVRMLSGIPIVYQIFE